MDILSNTNVSGILKATKIKQSFHNHYDPTNPNDENGFFYVPVYEVYTTTFEVGEKSKTIYYGFSPIRIHQSFKQSMSTVVNK